MDKDNIISNTPYDDAYRTMYVECDELILPLLNEIFHEDYKGNEKIIRFSNEHYSPQLGGAEEKKITDSYLEVIGGERKRYHCECESGTDGTIIIRMFQYGSQLALTDAEFNGKKLSVSFPNAAVLYLRSTRNTPDSMEIEINTPGGNISYKIPVIKMASYSIEDIFEKKLFFLIPFYIFNLRSRLKEYNEDSEKLKGLKKIYTDIFIRIEKLEREEKISGLSKHVIRDLTNRVAQNLAYKYEAVRKGIGDIMGGQVLDLEVIRIKHECEDRVRAEMEQKEKQHMDEINRQKVELELLKAKCKRLEDQVNSLKAAK